MRLLVSLILAFPLALPPVAAASGVVLQVEQQLGEPEDGTLATRDGDGAVRFRMTVDYRCPEAEANAALFLSVAEAALAAEPGESPQAVIVAVPAAQLAGIREATKCEAPGARVLEGQVQAFATLSCFFGEQRDSRTIAVPLSLWFDCPADSP